MQFTDLHAEIVNEIRQWYLRNGHDPDSAAAKATIKLNSQLVPERSEMALAALNRSLRNVDVLDIGAGYGTMALYFVLTHAPRTYLAADLNPDFTIVSERIVQSHAEHFPGLRFAKEDMRHLKLGDRSVDVVLCHNAFVYFTEWSDARKAMAEFRRVLRPGGSILVYGPNRWYPKEPFTGITGIQFLPNRVAHWISKRIGTRRGYADLRLHSPLDMWRLFRGTGFVAPRFETPAGRRGYLGSFSIPFWPYLYCIASRAH